MLFGEGWRQASGSLSIDGIRRKDRRALDHEGARLTEFCEELPASGNGVVDSSDRDGRRCALGDLPSRDQEQTVIVGVRAA
jgi:hypothetical protein